MRSPRVAAPRSSSCMPAQHRSDGATAQVLRKYSNLDLKLFYSSFTGNAAQAAAPAITNIQGILIGNDGQLPGDRDGRSERGHPVGLGRLHRHRRPAAPSTGSRSTSTAVPGNPNLYSGTFTLPSGAAAGDIRFIVQAANGAGLVTHRRQPRRVQPRVRRLGVDAAAPATTLVLRQLADVGRRRSDAINATRDPHQRRQAGRRQDGHVLGRQRPGAGVTNASGVATATCC